MENFLRDLYIYAIAILLGYILWGLVSYKLTLVIMSKVWKKTTKSYEKMYNHEAPVELDSEKRKAFNWAPSLIGILERIIYTSAIVFGQLILIGIWLTFKAIGQWGDVEFSNRNNSRNNDRNNALQGATRMRANNFLIGTALSLLFGIFGGIIFRLSLSSNFLVDLIQKSYK